MAYPGRRYKRRTPRQYSRNNGFISQHQNQPPQAIQEPAIDDESNTNPITITNRIKWYEGWTTTDRIAVIAVVVNATLAFFTVLLFSIASHEADNSDKSATAANNSATIAQNTFDEFKKYNTASLQLQQKAFESGNQSSKENFTRVDKSLTLQDSSLKETQKEFDKENMPYIQAGNFIVNIDTMNFIVGVDYVFFNNGRQPVKVIDGKYKTSITEKEITMRQVDSTIKLNNFKPVNDYISPGLPSHEAYDNFKINKGIYDNIKNGKMIFTVYGFIRYFNLIPRKIRYYKFVAIINKIGGINYNMKYSENY